MKPISGGRLLGALAGLAVACGTGSGSAEGTARRTPIVEAVERVAPATVNILTQYPERQSNPFFRRDPFFDLFFERRGFPERRQSRQPERAGAGTGVIVDRSGYVLTNEHVLAGAERIWVSLVDGREFPGALVGADPDTDLAVLKVEGAEDLPVASLADDGDLLIGETVVAIGNPFGLNHTVTTGVLSATNRSFRHEKADYHGFLQTDASINPGNSGGPLLNLDGEVIGINTAIFQEAQGIGFAIPIDRARRIMNDLISYGEVIPVWLGLWFEELTPPLRQTLGVQAAHGALVRYVFADSPADRSGLEPGDVLLALDGSSIQSVVNYFEILRGLTEGTTGTLRLERAGRVREVEVTAEQIPAAVTDELAKLMLGFTLREMNPQERRLYGPPGMVIDQLVPESRAARRLLAGDVIRTIEEEPLVNLEGYRKLILRLRGRGQTLLRVQRGRDRARLALSLS